MSETQLERSVLEAKEREELFAIADALGAKPGARAKKADLVTQILRATGIDPEPAGQTEEKPRRTRARKTTASPTEAGESGGSSAPTGDEAPAVNAPAVNMAGRSRGRADEARAGVGGGSGVGSGTNDLDVAAGRAGAAGAAVGAVGGRAQAA